MVGGREEKLGGEEDKRKDAKNRGTKQKKRFKRGITLTPQNFDSSNDDLLRGSGIDKERGREREKSYGGRGRGGGGRRR